MSIIEAIILGIIQGLTEFLPVSSSGHLEIGKAILGAEVEDQLFFSVLVHTATALSTIVIFRKDIYVLLKSSLSLKKNKENTFLAQILLSALPIFFVGLFFKDFIEFFFEGKLLLVGSMLIVTGILLSISHFTRNKQKKITYTSALVLGVVQAIAVLPGISRSGATIATALLLGIDKKEATRFSFLMVLLPILGASFLEIISFLRQPVMEDYSLAALISGFLAAFFSGCIACLWMIKIVQRQKLIYFALYCWVLGGVAIIWLLST